MGGSPPTLVHAAFTSTSMPITGRASNASTAPSSRGVGRSRRVALRLPLVASAALAALFAVFHGQAHGAEMPVTMAGLTYGLGFVLATGRLHSLGIGIGLLARRAADRLVRTLGAATAAYGVYLLV